MAQEICKGKSAGWCESVYDRFIRIQGRPRDIAMGFALGLFVGMTPTMGFQMAIAVFIAAILRWNKFSSVAGVWITNPVTAPFIYGMNYMVGKKMFHIEVVTPSIGNMSMKSLVDLLCETPDIFLAMTLGGIVVGIPLAIGGYYLAYAAVKNYQTLKKKHAHHHPGA